MARTAKPVAPDALRREAGGRYRSGDGRFVVEAAGSGWMLEDGERTDDLGLPLVRGPFPTLDAAREALVLARTGPAPVSDLAARLHARPARRASPPPVAPPAEPPAPPPPPPIGVRPVRVGEGERLRAFWASIGMEGLGDDDDGLDRLIRRNPGLSLVALRGGEIVGTALAAWDGRRGWLYHVGVAPGERRTGLGTDLVRRVEAKLRELGAPKVNAVVMDDNADAVGFWRRIGYTMTEARQYGRLLDEDAATE